MLARLTIANLATIRSLSIEFEQGFTVLTGETGAGKSILIDAIRFVLGAKADAEQIRSGEKGTFESPGKTSEAPLRVPSSTGHFQSVRDDDSLKSQRVAQDPADNLCVEARRHELLSSHRVCDVRHHDHFNAGLDGTLKRNDVFPAQIVERAFYLGERFV
ncbi:MAG: AAA family ATPase [Candidatus Krumholzibacteriota bacterium]|nr:AAA family ATPase [Candidatus Krumholzibacteriota bacterium]